MKNKNGFDGRKNNSGRVSVLERLMTQQPQRYKQIIEYIKLGTYDHVAAQACGVSPDSWYRWLRKGSSERDTIYRRFFLDVRRAQAHARVMAEITVKQQDPKYWLRVGPGKTRFSEGVPLDGWNEEPSVVRIEGGDPNRPVRLEADQTNNILDNITAMIGVLRTAGLLNDQNLAELLSQADRQMSNAPSLNSPNHNVISVGFIPDDEGPDDEDLEEVDG